MRWPNLTDKVQHSPTTFVTSLFCGDELVLLYLGGYVMLIWALAVLVSSLVWGGSGVTGFAGFVSLLQRSRLRWAVVIVLLSLAGLPPFFFFGCKLGLLSALLFSGSWGLAGVVALLILFSWVVYFSIVRRLFSSFAADAGVPLWQGRCSAATALLAVGTTLAAGIGLFFIDDALLFVTWLFIE